MSYREDQDYLYSRSEKIPYDDTPISRKPDSRSSSPLKKMKNFKNQPGVSKVLVSIVAIMFCLNVVLVGVVIWTVKNGGDRYVNVYNNSITTSGEDGYVSEYAMQTAWYNTVCVAAGGQIGDKSSFFSRAQSRGSGIILEKDDDYVYILTCFHVVDGYENKVSVLFQSWDNPVSATFIGASKSNDVAVLRVKNSQNFDPCNAVIFADSQFLKPSETVFTIGNAISTNLKFTKGAVSSINDMVSIDGRIAREIVFSAAIQPGNSGGGLFNAEGKLIGLVNAKLTSVKSNDNTIPVELTSYAIPGNYAVGIGKSIIKNGSAISISIGANFVNDKDSPISSTVIDGNLINQNYRVIVNSVVSASPASTKLRKGDEIVSFTYVSIIDGQRHTVYMTNQYCFEDVSFLVQKDSEVQFTVIRGGAEPQTISVLASSTTIQN